MRRRWKKTFVEKKNCTRYITRKIICIYKFSFLEGLYITTNTLLEFSKPPLKSHFISSSKNIFKKKNFLNKK